MPRPPASPSPPPATFAIVTGNFDYPRATGIPAAPPPRGDRLEWLRIRNRQSLEQLNRRDSPAANGEAAVSSLNNRPRATASSQRNLRRSYSRWREQRESEIDSMHNQEDVLDPATRRPRVFENPFSAAHSRLHSAHDEPEFPPRRVKRRKVNHEPTPEFRYGHKGQVVPGRLRMEIVSYDGGEYGGEYGAHSACGRYPIENVLKNDKSVYCSEKSRCNLLLKHIGEAPFTLDKIVIRAPDRGYTAPVQEGLIFVSMSEDILSATSGYKIDYGSTSPPMSPRLSTPGSVGDQLLSFQEAINDPNIWETYRQGVEGLDMESLRLRSRQLRTEDPAHSDRGHQSGDIRAQTASSLYSQFPEICEDPPSDELPAIAGVSAPTPPPPFTVLNESEDESEDDEELPSAADIAGRLRRERRGRDELDEEDEHDTLSPPRQLPRYSSRFTRLWDDVHRVRLPNMQNLDSVRPTRRQSPSRIEPKDSNAASEPVILPNAKFFIAKHKSKITIKFHPTISGKYILLKLWSPTHDGNIDIESVQFFGYSGPRFFPAIQLC